MAERRRSAHAGDDRNNGGTLSAKKPRDRNLVIYIDRWSVCAVNGKNSVMVEQYIVTQWRSRHNGDTVRAAVHFK